MNDKVLVEAGIDVEAALVAFFGDADFYAEMLAKLPGKDYLDRLVAAFDANDCATAFACAHDLKGLAGNLCLVSLHMSVSLMTDELREGCLDEGRLLLPQVCADYERAVEAIQAAV